MLRSSYKEVEEFVCMLVCVQNIPVVQSQTSDSVFNIVLDMFLKSNERSVGKVSNVTTA